jgi:hypothetical protein
MHTTKIGNYTFIHNGDYSGNTRIVNGLTHEEMEVPFDALKGLVAEYVRDERISKLEQAEDDELLGLEVKK